MGSRGVVTVWAARERSKQRREREKEICEAIGAIQTFRISLSFFSAPDASTWLESHTESERDSPNGEFIRMKCG